MAKGKARKKISNPDEFFVRLHHGFMKEAAWRDLKVGPRALYVELAMRYNGHNNGNITLSVREAANALNCAANTIKTWLVELQDHGYLRERSKGHLGMGGKGIATHWELTEFGRGGMLPTKEFKKWSVKNNIPCQSVIQGVSVSDTPKRGSVSMSDTGVSVSDTGNTEKHPIPVSVTDTYIESTPYGLAKPTTQNPDGVGTQSSQNNSHSKLAEKLGPHGWVFIMDLAEKSNHLLEILVAKNEAGTLTSQDLAEAQLIIGMPKPADPPVLERQQTTENTSKR